jgi:hypothetical protein
MRMNKQTINRPIIVKAQIGYYIIFLPILCFFLIDEIISLCKGNSPNILNDILGTAMVSLPLILILIGLSRVYLKIENGYLKYRYMIGKEKSIKIEEVETSYFEVLSRAKNGFVRWVIRSKGIMHDFYINPTLFTPKDRAKIMVYLPMKEVESTTAVGNSLRKWLLNNSNYYLKVRKKDNEK